MTAPTFSQNAYRQAPASQATAGFLNTDWNPRDVPTGTTTSNVVLRTADGAATSGSLYQPATPADTVVCVMHPREFMACHYLVPDIIDSGCAAWSQGSRSVGNDLRHPKVEGPRPLKVRFINWYLGKLHMAARHDAKLAIAFLEVANLEAPPTRLLHPAIVTRVIRGNLGTRRGNAEATPASARA